MTNITYLIGLNVPVAVPVSENTPIQGHTRSHNALVHLSVSFLKCMPHPAHEIVTRTTFLASLLSQSVPRISSSPVHEDTISWSAHYSSSQTPGDQAFVIVRICGVNRIIFTFFFNALVCLRNSVLSWKFKMFHLILKFMDCNIPDVSNEFWCAGVIKTFINTHHLYFGTSYRFHKFYKFKWKHHFI